MKSLRSAVRRAAAGVLLGAAACVAAAAPPARGGAPQPAAEARVIVSLKAGSATLRRRALGANHGAETVAEVTQQRANTLGARLGMALRAGRPVGPRALVVMASGIGSAELAARLAADPEVEYAEPDRRRRIAAVPNDPLYLSVPASGEGPAVGQWYLRAPDATIRSAVNAEAAWDIVTGNASIVVAVLDTGVLFQHPDLAGRTLPGRDLIADVAAANDGNGRDADATDAGDWIDSTDHSSGNFSRTECPLQDSSWHGTQVAGIVGAIANNGVGMAGTAHGVNILPVRVLGKCGGYDSDIVAGIYWAAGVSQQGLPGSTTPARVLNLSLGGEGACSFTYRNAIATVTAAPYHAVVVAAAGNSTGHAVSTPANCPGAIGVTGLRHAGSKVGFSDLGPEITIAAPGGNCINIEPGEPCLYPILTTSNDGRQSPGNHIWTNSFRISVGTSFATPIVAGAVALMLSARPSLTNADVIATLQNTARPFPTSGADNGTDPTPVPMCRFPDDTAQLQCYCSVGLCGAGMLDAAAAVRAVVQGVSPQEAARQLFAYAERVYPQLVPGSPPTQVQAPFHYRFYPATGVYLGVAVQSDSTYVLGGVYVLGGPFGNNVTFVGMLNDYITPVPAALAPTRAR